MIEVYYKQVYGEYKTKHKTDFLVSQRKMAATVKTEEISVLFTNALKNGLKDEDIKSSTGATLLKDVQPKNKHQPRSYLKTVVLIAIISVLVGVQLPKYAYEDPVEYARSTFFSYVYDPESECIIMNGEPTIEITRKPVDCAICRDLTEVPMFYNMTKEYFTKHHAYSGIPALIKGGAKEWSALNVFGIEYFKEVYDQEALEEFQDKQCQFFAYKTNLASLKHVFKMSKKRQQLKKDQWYVGWSNCVTKTQNKLRKHYQRPAFLPTDSESSALDWIFMGGSGTGAMMHIDGVNRPSWQAMIKGSKTWYIEPPPECFSECSTKRMNATMEQGDILVIDTNKWFHSTFIHPVGLSITIGSEYD